MLKVEVANIQSTKCKLFIAIFSYTCSSHREATWPRENCGYKFSLMILLSRLWTALFFRGKQLVSSGFKIIIVNTGSRLDRKSTSRARTHSRIARVLLWRQGRPQEERITRKLSNTKWFIVSSRHNHILIRPEKQFHDSSTLSLSLSLFVSHRAHSKIYCNYGIFGVISLRSIVSSKRSEALITVNI